MTERPILFSGEMVRAILDGRKTQTRRVVRPQPDGNGEITRWQASFDGLSWTPDYGHGADVMPPWRCPYGKPGDRLWVRETWAPESDDVDGIPGAVHYRATPRFEGPAGCWRPSIHMPRWASRITLEITDVRVERVQDISGPDVMREGYNGSRGTHLYDARLWFASLWDSIAKPGETWTDNPHVWVVTFKRVTP